MVEGDWYGVGVGMVGAGTGIAAQGVAAIPASSDLRLSSIVDCLQCGFAVNGLAGFMVEDAGLLGVGVCLGVCGLPADHQHAFCAGGEAGQCRVLGGIRAGGQKLGALFGGFHGVPGADRLVSGLRGAHSLRCFVDFVPDAPRYRLLYFRPEPGVLQLGAVQGAAAYPYRYQGVAQPVPLGQQTDQLGAALVVEQVYPRHVARIPHCALLSNELAQ